MLSLVSRRLLEQSATQVAPLLLGAIIQTSKNDKVTSGIIVETEAYLGENDPASHSVRGETLRNRSMFLRAGTAYVYRIYGHHLCLNVVTGKSGQGEAVLIRAIEPLEGVKVMEQRRRITDRIQLGNGPAKLVEALGITTEFDGVDLLTNSAIQLLERSVTSSEQIVISKRIGITRGIDLPYRFFLKDSPYLSRKS